MRRDLVQNENARETGSRVPQISMRALEGPLHFGLESVTLKTNGAPCLDRFYCTTRAVVAHTLRSLR